MVTVLQYLLITALHTYHGGKHWTENIQNIEKILKLFCFTPRIYMEKYWKRWYLLTIFQRLSVLFVVTIWKEEEGKNSLFRCCKEVKLAESKKIKLFQFIVFCFWLFANWNSVRLIFQGKWIIQFPNSRKMNVPFIYSFIHFYSFRLSKESNVPIQWQ